MKINEWRPRSLLDWLPALAAGFIAAAAFVWLGQTPVARALGLAAAVVGVTLALQRFSRVLAVIGGLALAFSPAFWSQTGGGEQPLLTLILVLLAVAAGLMLLLVIVSQKPTLGLAIGAVIFVLLFWGLTGTPRSLRLTTLLTAWTLYLLIDALLIANPRADMTFTGTLGWQHTFGLLLAFTLGVFNDPLFVLLFPALALGLLLLRLRLPWWYWGVLLVMLVIGLQGAAAQYLVSDWWGFPAREAMAQGIRVPYVMADGWREASRWLDLINILVSQFTVVGILLGVLGLSRLSRWHPAVGEVTMVAFAAYALFGLVYFGKDSSVLLLPLLMIQVIWMTYAVYAFGQWLQKSVRSAQNAVRWVAPAAFTLIPLFMLLRILGERGG